jgi:DnaK suppressor protein
LFLGTLVERRLWRVDCISRSMLQTLSANKLKRFRSLLEVRISELERATCKRDDIAVETNADQMDDIQRAAERDLAICNIDRESHELRNARAALRRIAHGTFGVCEECEEGISPKRLAAIPWASRCIVCQEASDRTSGEMGTFSHALIGNAA